MSQKAKTGGTPGKAPLGYRNVGVLNDEGRETRTVIVDPERAALISWAFKTYATGAWTIRDLARELETQGLSAPPTPSRAGPLITPVKLHKILRNPYYKGDVTFQGATFPGRHEALVDPVTWLKVQAVMASHVLGEKERVHTHYLKSSVYCGGCESRLLVHHAKNRFGTVYEYFICSGRHEKRTTCRRQAVSIARVEQLVVDHYQTIALSPALRVSLEAALRTELSTAINEAEAAHHSLALEHSRLQARSKKLLDGHLDGVIPLDLYRTEQTDITRRTTTILQGIAVAEATLSTLESNLSRALELAENCYEAYLRAPDSIRRQFNQAFFERIFVDVDEDVAISSKLSEPFHAICSRNDETTDLTTGEAVILNAENKEPQSTFYRDWGSRDNSLVPLEGLEPPTLSLGRNCSSIELQRLTGKV
jgi:site-specific DNA recombinase